MRSTGFEPGSTKGDADSLRTELIRTGTESLETNKYNLASSARTVQPTATSLKFPEPTKSYIVVDE